MPALATCFKDRRRRASALLSAALLAAVAQLAWSVVVSVRVVVPAVADAQVSRPR